jgi:hypothetical protein
VSDIVKGVFGGMWPLLVGWILPSAVVLAVFGIVVLPALQSVALFNDLDAASASTQALVLLASAVLVGWLLSCLQTPLYRVLEGYLGWPSAAQAAAIRRHADERASLEQQLAAEDAGLAQAKVLEAFLRYPNDVDHVAPTRLGNAIRRFEFYGQNRYQLDSQYLWFQLRASVPESLAREIDAARAGVDFFVCLCYLSGALAVSSLGGLLADADRWPGLVALAGGAVVAAIGAYKGAVLATDGWAAGVRAMVDLGRTGLASSLGLAIPDKLEDERRMWLAVGWLTVYPYDDQAARAIDEFRAPHPGAEPSGQ